MHYIVDSQWVNLNNEVNSDGEPLPPRLALNVRTGGGMIIGRVCRNGNEFIGERWQSGEFVEVGAFATTQEAADAIAGRT